MDKINWCKKQDKGIKLVEPNENLAFGYLKMSEDSLGTMNREKDKNLIFSISAGYYSIYYSLYAVMQKIGVKCEIHICSIEFMKSFLNDFYLEENFELIETAFSLRNLLQYYVGKNANKNEVSLVWNNAYDFFVKSRDIVARLNELQIKQIRRKLS